MGSEDLFVFPSFTKSGLVQDTCSMKINLNGENTDLSYPPLVLGESGA